MKKKYKKIKINKKLNKKIKAFEIVSITSSTFLLHTVYHEFISLYALKFLLKIMASAYDFTVNIAMLINIIITNKTFNIHDLVKNIIYAASTYDFAVTIVMAINM